MKYKAGDRKGVFDKRGNRVGEFVSTGDIREDLKLAHAVFEELGLSAPPKPRSIRIFQHGKNFARIARNIHREVQHLGQRSANLLGPLAVNLAFSLELYLKALGAASGVKLWGHKLLELYDDLPIELQELIAQIANELPLRNEMPERIQIRESLSELNSTFEEFRYSFDFDSEPLLFLKEDAFFILDALEKAFLKFLRKLT